MSGNYVINIGRQLGSGGKEIGEKLAALLNEQAEQLKKEADKLGKP